MVSYNATSELVDKHSCHFANPLSIEPYWTLGGTDRLVRQPFNTIKVYTTLLYQFALDISYTKAWFVVATTLTWHCVNSSQQLEIIVDYVKSFSTHIVPA